MKSNDENDPLMPFQPSGERGGRLFRVFWAAHFFVLGLCVLGLSIVFFAKGEPKGAVCMLLFSIAAFCIGRLFVLANRSDDQQP